ncbi:MAG: hypothetical protein ACR2PX_17105 [Endozoicomonas sp.]|uniref:hypothetical protein n=1 Tax=Endozoicomonas sp. TaxID=1892382 RepID=UPI003D9AF2BF
MSKGCENLPDHHYYRFHLSTPKAKPVAVTHQLFPTGNNEMFYPWNQHSDSHAGVEYFGSPISYTFQGTPYPDRNTVRFTVKRKTSNGYKAISGQTMYRRFLRHRALSPLFIPMNCGAGVVSINTRLPMKTGPGSISL